MNQDEFLLKRMCLYVDVFIMYIFCTPQEKVNGPVNCQKNHLQQNADLERAIFTRNYTSNTTFFLRMAFKIIYILFLLLHKEMPKSSFSSVQLFIQQ